MFIRSTLQYSADGQTLPSPVTRLQFTLTLEKELTYQMGMNLLFHWYICKGYDLHN